MRLLIDVGNTALKWALVDAAGMPGKACTEVHRGTDDLAARLVSAWQSLSLHSPALACSVAAPDVRSAAEQAAAECGVTVQWLAAEAQHAGRVGLINGYRTPTQLGADRWHGMLGACHRRPAQSFVLIAAGTATTIDCVEAGEPCARFIGGCISPGKQMMLEALAQRTAGLPHARGHAVDFPDNTEDAIATGVADAQAGLAARLIERFAHRLGNAPAVLVSGGDAEPVAERLIASGVELAIEHNLVLAGLALRAWSFQSPLRQ
jgi:type III pantothenate kinase